jgi:hypothetical protein
VHTTILDPETREAIRVDLLRDMLLLDELEHTPLDRVTDVRRWQQAQELLREEIREAERLLGEKR